MDWGSVVANDRVHGTWQGPNGPEDVSFKGSWGSHTFTPEEREDLLDGKIVTIKSYRGGRDVRGKLEHYSFVTDSGEQRNTFGFHRLPDPDDERVSGIWMGPDGAEEVTFKRVWGKAAPHRFTDDEVDELLAGGEVTIHDYPTKSGPMDLPGRLGHYTYPDPKTGEPRKAFGFHLPDRG